MGGFKDKIISLFKTNTTENNSKPTRVMNVHKGPKKSRKPKVEKTVGTQNNHSNQSA